MPYSASDRVIRYLDCKCTCLSQSATVALELDPVQDEDGPAGPRGVDVPEQADLVAEAGAHVDLGAVEVPDGDVDPLPWVRRSWHSSRFAIILPSRVVRVMFL